MTNQTKAQMKRPSVFLSHNTKDKPFARRVGQALRSAGATVWIDEAEIKLGDSLVRKIGEGLHSSDYLAVVLSPDSVGSDWVRREVEIATNREIAGKRVIVLPLLYRTCEIPVFLADKLYADFTNPREFSEPLNLVLERLGLELSPAERAEHAVAEDLLHELRAPMTMARHQLSVLLREGGGTPQMAHGFERLASLLHRAELVISTFRLLRLYSTDHYPLHVESQRAIADIVSDAIRYIVPQFRDGVTVRFEATSRPRASCDVRLIEMAVSNLLDNALKYSFERSEVQIECKEDEHTVSVIVANAGLNIPPDDTELIFQKGYRCQEASWLTGEGNGLGLYVTRQIMMSHGGEVRYRSRGQRHEFTLNWPKRYSAEAA